MKTASLVRSKYWLLCFCLLPAACCLLALGESYSIDWFSVDSGGGASTGGEFSVTGTAGQPDAGDNMSGGEFSVTGGFWSVIAALETPGAPALTIKRTTTNTVAVTWPSPSAGWNLQVNITGITTTNWTTISPTVIQDDGTTKTLIANPPAGNRFYRLISP